MTRRALLKGLAAQVAGSGLIKTDNEDTDLMLIGASAKGDFCIGVQTRVKADWAIVEVFYKQIVPGIPSSLLLSKQSIAPVTSLGYGVTRDNFTMSRSDVQFMRVTFVAEVARRKSLGLLIAGTRK